MPPKVVQTIPLLDEQRTISLTNTDGLLAITTPTLRADSRQTLEILNPTNWSYVNHRALTATQKAIRDYWGIVVSNGVPANSITIFEQWANTLYRDAITQRAVGPDLSVTDRQESVTRVAEDILLTNSEILVLSPLESTYLTRLTALIGSIEALRTQNIDRAKALGIAQEFGRLTKDRQWESEVPYLAAYKVLTKNRELSVAELIEASRPYMNLNDPYLTKSILGYISELPQQYQVTEEESQLIQQFVKTAKESNRF